MKKLGELAERAEAKRRHHYLDEKEKAEAHAKQLSFFILGADVGNYNGDKRAEFLVYFGRDPEAHTLDDLEEKGALYCLALPFTRYRGELVAGVQEAKGEPVGPCRLEQLPARNSRGWIWNLVEADPA